jgi:hypothetical protein
MTDAITETLREFGLAEKTLILIDEFQSLDFGHYRCASHILNLAVHKSLEFD